MRNGKMLVAAIIVTAIILGFAKGTLASCCRKRADVLLTYNYGVRVSPRPPGWPQILFAKNVIKSFNEKGLRVENINNESKNQNSYLSALTKEALEFSVALNTGTLKGCVLEFNRIRDFKKVLNHYLDLNEAGELHTWSFAKDNILVVIEGTMPAQIVREYRDVLASMK